MSEKHAVTANIGNIGHSHARGMASTNVARLFQESDK
ncbi:hypothetical protein BH24PSE1_BH24PSE1_10590 [soil metagenome]